MLWPLLILNRLMLRVLARGHRACFGTKYSRFYLEDLAIDREAIQREEAAVAEKQRLQAVFNLPANSNNPKNHVKLRINAGVASANPKPTYARDSCWVLEPKPLQPTPAVTISATRKYIITSIKKAKDSLMFLKKRHVLDAINRMEQSHRKVPKALLRTFYNLLDHAKRRGLNPTRLWVHGCIIGLTKRYRSIRYAAKGRSYREKRDFCQVKVILWEKPEKDFYEEIAVGESAPGISNLVRFILKSQQADYKQLARFSGVTTAKGKQQAKLIFKRRVDQVMISNKEQGKYEPRKVIAERLRTELGEAMKEKLATLQQQQHSSLRLRERLYKKNMGL